MSATIDSRPLFLRATSVMFALVQSGLMLAGIICWPACLRCRKVTGASSKKVVRRFSPETMMP